MSFQSRLFRRIGEPIRRGLSWEEKWAGADRGVIFCWERGRELQRENAELAWRAERGELPILPWRGGVTRKLQDDKKAGSLQYLAMWQGLRNEDLDIPLGVPVEVRCTATGQCVQFSVATDDQPEESDEAIE